MTGGIGLLGTGEAPGHQGEEQGGDSREETGPAGAGRGSEEVQQGQGKRKGQQHQRQNGPGIGGQQIVHLPEPGLEDEFRNLVDAVLREIAGKFQVVAHI